MTTYSTVWPGPISGFSENIQILKRSTIGNWGVFKNILKIKRGDSILLNGAMGVNAFWIDMFYAIFIKLFKRDVTVLISDATWNPRSMAEGSNAPRMFYIYEQIQKMLLLLSKSKLTHYSFLSRTEVEVVSREARIAPSNIHFTPFCSSLPDGFSQPATTVDDSKDQLTFFAGGNSLRDYRTLCSAAQDAPHQFFIASSLPHGALPENIEFRGVSNKDFFDLMALSDVAIVPILPIKGRSVGQQTYLNALALGKPLIVSDVIGVRDHLEHETHALIVPPQDAVALRKAIDWMADPQNALARQAMGSRGKAHVATMTPVHYLAALESLLNRLTRRAGAA